jgi:ribosomal protein S18 acetylase RimI-like enzyme
MNRQDLNIRTMTADDLDFAVDLAAAENWLSETRSSFEAFLGHDPDGCFVGEVGGHRIGICVATGYGEYGFLGELIVIPERRNRGLGRNLLQHAIDYLSSKGCSTQFLDADLPAVPLYERLGFRPVCQSLRYLGRIDGRQSHPARAMTPNDLENVAALDWRSFGANRSYFLEYRLERFPQLCRVMERERKISGFIMGWPGRGVVTAGPWVVRQDEIQPLALLYDLAQTCGDTPVRLGVLECNQRAMTLLDAVPGLETQTPCVRMARGPRDDLGTAPECLAVGSPAAG